MSYLINSSWGADDLERATIPFVVANAAAGKGAARVFLTGEAVSLAVKGRAADWVAEGYTPVQTLVYEYVAKGGQIWVCPVCAEVQGITAEDLIDGASIAGAAATMGFLEDGGKLLF